MIVTEIDEVNICVKMMPNIHYYKLYKLFVSFVFVVVNKVRFTQLGAVLVVTAGRLRRWMRVLREKVGIVVVFHAHQFYGVFSRIEMAHCEITLLLRSIESRT